MPDSYVVSTITYGFLTAVTLAISDASSKIVSSSSILATLDLDFTIRYRQFILERKDILMAIQSVPINHHWVPQFYLKYFSPAPNASSPRIYVTDKAFAYKTGQLVSKTERIRDIASALHLYNKVKPDGAIDPTLELQFGAIEKEAGEVWNCLSNAGSLNITRNGAHRTIISKFLAAQHLRVPRMIAVAEQLLRGLDFEIAMDQMDDETLEKIHAQIGSIDINLGGTVDDIDMRGNFREMISKNMVELQKILHDMTWSIVVFDKPDLITSDSPLYVINGGTFSAWAHGQPESLTYYPMTRYHLLVLSGSRISGPVDGRIKSMSGPALVEKINGFTLHFADSKVYSAVDLKNKFAVLNY